MRKRIVVFCAAAALLLVPHFAGASDSCNYAFPGTPGTHPFQWCISADGNPTAPHDWVGRVNYDLGTIEPLKKKVVKYQYRLD